MPRLTRAFFKGYSPKVARALLGKRLVRVADGARLAGLIVETEAYRGSKDGASHAFRGMTKRNEVMFGEPGHAYVYFTYGNHWLLNLTVEGVGKPAAVLLRALEPTEAVGVMMRNRGVDRKVEVASGPGKLTKALSLGREFNGEDVVRSERLFLEDAPTPRRVGTSSRVGVNVGWEQKWRFFIKGNAFVSRGKPSGPRNP